MRSSGKKIPPPNIFGYLDYRSYLQDLTNQLRAQDSGFTVREFARRAGLKSPGLLKMVIDGTRNLTAESAASFCQAFDLGGKARCYFEMLVRYNQATSPDERVELFDALNRLRPRSHQFTLEKKHHRYLTRDHYVAIREMVLLKGFREDDDWIAERLRPAITASEAREAVATLLELGMLRRRQDGRLEQADDFVRTTDGNTQALEAYHFHDAVLSRARTMLGFLQQEKRSYYALTLPLPKTMVSEIIADFYALRDRIVAKINQAGLEYDEVYQMNFQFFPLTEKKSDEH